MTKVGARCIRLGMFLSSSLWLPVFGFVTFRRRTTSTLTYQASSHQMSLSSFDSNDMPSFLTETDFYDEGMPRHVMDPEALWSAPLMLASENSWGVHHARSRTTPSFPGTIQTLISDMTNAIIGTLDGKQKLDPNYVVNAMMGNNTVGRRPVRRSLDVGRMGLELDGVASLFDGHLSEANALRKIALQLAAELSMTRKVPVAVYLNTIRQSLVASRELQLLRRIEQHSSLKPKSEHESIYSNITVSTLGADDLPNSMRQHERLRPPQLAQGLVDANRGIILVIQPTDFNAEYRPPGPAIGSVAALQALAGRASLHGVPVILLSPRFLTMQSPGGGGWDQSGYQQSSSYGGFEPARGPTPWIMRDFSPPIYCWSSKVMRASEQPLLGDGDDVGSSCSHLGLMQSVMIAGHSWHVFAKQREPPSSRQRQNYVYLASTQASAGRPTKEVLHRIYHEFAT